VSDKKPNNFDKTLNKILIGLVGIFLLLAVIIFVTNPDDTELNGVSSSTSNNVNSTVTAQKGVIKKNGLICTSSQALDNQVDLLVNEKMQFANGCFIIPEAQAATLIDRDFSGTCVVRRNSDSKKLWTLCEDYE